VRVLLLGATGQLGKEFVIMLEKKGIDFLALTHKDYDVVDLERGFSIFDNYKPDIVINCSAYNMVDKAEKEKGLAFKVNVIGPRNLAFLCRRYKSFLVHYSSDYVFDGCKEYFYFEDDVPNPINEYGKSKLLGEWYIKEELDSKYLIFRTSWVYGVGKQNFIYKILQWSKSLDYLRITCDEFSIPTSTNTIVRMTLLSLDKGLVGLYHLTNSGYASRYEWAKSVFKILKIKKFIYPVYQKDFDLPAKRPRFTPMSNERISSDLGVEIRGWDEELEDFLIRRFIRE
jgi:dTDP-4-dehydrorhamnose reductase